MTRLRCPSSSAERLSELLGLIYEAALEPETWAAALSAIRERPFDANFVSLIVRPGSGDDLGLIVSAAGDQRTIDPNNAAAVDEPVLRAAARPAGDGGRRADRRPTGVPRPTSATGARRTTSTT
jgi:hypothetical protein